MKKRDDDLRPRAGRGSAFAERGAAKLAAPDHQCLIEHAAALEVTQSRCHRPVHSPAFVAQAVRDRLAGIGAVEVPSPIVQLNKPYSLFDQSTGQQAVVGKAGHRASPRTCR